MSVTVQIARRLARLVLLDRLGRVRALRLWVGAAAMLAILGVVIMIALYRVWDHQQFADQTILAQFTEDSLRGLEADISLISSEASSLASSPTFTSPDDADRDDYRYWLFRRPTAERFLAMERLDSVLTTKNGTVNAKSLLGKSVLVPVWSLARGLPLRDQDGKLLARNRRLAADVVIRGLKYRTLSIAELDRSGDVVFMTPYRQQLSLARFQFLVRESKDDSARVQIGPGITTSRTSLVFVTTVKQIGGNRWLIAELDPAEIAEHALRTNSLGPLRMVSIVGRNSNATVEADVFQFDAAKPKGQWISPLQEEKAVSTSGIDLILTTAMGVSPIYASILRTGWQVFAAGMLLVFGMIHLIGHMWALLEKRDHHIGGLERVAIERVNVVAHNIRNNLNSFRNILYSPSWGISASLQNTLWHPLRQITEKLDALPNEVLGIFWPERAARYEGDPSVCLVHAVRQEIEIRSFAQSRFKFDFRNLDPSQFFCRVTQSDISVIISHLLTNGLESAAKRKKRSPDPIVTLHLDRVGDRVQLRVEDNGTGIDSDVRMRLFEEGVSTKTTSGGRRRGNGLYTSKVLVEKWNGSISEEPKVGPGTVMLVELDSSPPPASLANSIRMANCRRVVIVDDDDEIFVYWKELLERNFGERIPETHRPEFLKISSPQAFQDYMRDLAAEEAASSIYLIDYQFNESNITGLNLIDELNLRDRAVLVTNYAEDQQVLFLIERQRISFIPKWSMPYLKFDFQWEATRAQSNMG